MKHIKVTNTQGESFEFYDNSNGVIIRDFNGFEYPRVKTVIATVPGVGGDKYLTSRFGGRRISWQGDLVGSNVFSKRRDLLKVMKQDGTLKLVQFKTYDGLELQVYAEVTGIPFPYNHKIQTFLMQMEAPDFRFLSQEEHSATMGESQILGGTPIPTPVPIDFSDSAGVIKYLNAGNEQSDVNYIIHGPGEGFTVRNQTTQRQFYINYAIGEGDTIEIDTRNRTVLLNGTINIYSALQGEFWTLISGENEILFGADSGANANTLLEIIWRDSYLGV